MACEGGLEGRVGQRPALRLCMEHPKLEKPKGLEPGYVLRAGVLANLLIEPVCSVEIAEVAEGFGEQGRRTGVSLRSRLRYATPPARHVANVPQRVAVEVGIERLL